MTTDLNDDGATDIAVVSANENTLTIYMGKGDGTFQGARSFPTGSKPSCIFSWDVNQDGVKDLLVGCKGEKAVRVHLGKRLE